MNVFSFSIFRVVVSLRVLCFFMCTTHKQSIIVYLRYAMYFKVENICFGSFCCFGSVHRIDTAWLWLYLLKVDLLYKKKNKKQKIKKQKQTTIEKKRSEELPNLMCLRSGIIIAKKRFIFCCCCYVVEEIKQKEPKENVNICETI